MNRKTSATSFLIYLLFIVYGFVAGELWYLTRAIHLRLDPYFTIPNSNFTLILLCIIGVFLIIFYYWEGNYTSKTINFLKSKRIDIILTFAFGFYVSWSFKGIGNQLYATALTFITPSQLLFLIFIPFVAGVAMVIRSLQLKYTERDEYIPSFFLNDDELKSQSDDMLDISEEAARFSKLVLNLNSPDSIVFGVDAPWGIGKSSFVNFCKNYWQDQDSNIIVYNFNPLRYNNRTHLLEQFIDGLTRSIQAQVFAPEIKPLINKYFRLIKPKASLSGIDFELSNGPDTIEDAFNNLEFALSTLTKKVIVIIDDLDRLNFDSIKDILFTIRKCFNLPNVSYVLCYDSDNIASIEFQQREKVTEFLEKFVNIKTTLILDSKILHNYVSKKLEVSLSSNPNIDFKRVNKALKALDEIYNSPALHNYTPFVGDVRKIKRLINTILMLEIEKTDFITGDFESIDLLNLTLIYINYPNIFRKIYNEETNGKRGFFSLAPKNRVNEIWNVPANQALINSEEYRNYINNSKLTPNQIFLLNNIFDVQTRFKSARPDEITEEALHTYACFNGGWNRGHNLEQYLKLIAKRKKPETQDQYRFYLRCTEEIIKGKTIKEILSKEEFSTSKGEANRQRLWRQIIFHPEGLSTQQVDQLIDYIVEHLQFYSLLSHNNFLIGLRDDLVFYLIKLLDTVSWVDEDGLHMNNSDENLKQIAQYIFGEGKRTGKNIIEILGNETRGILGLNDLLMFRLDCCAGSDASTFNLQRSLVQHANPDGQTTGLVDGIMIGEMREMSQKIFFLFETQYIKERKNIFQLIDNLTLSDFTGMYHKHISKLVASNEIIETERLIEATKSRLKSFISYQLGNSFIRSSIGCGFYDKEGTEDKRGIAKEINDYLFDICFNPEEDTNNYQHFLDYLLMNLTGVFSHSHMRKYIAHPEEFTKILDKNRLIAYWKYHQRTIKNLDLTAQSKTIYTLNYSATYTDNLPSIYEVLDKMSEELEQGLTEAIN